MISDLHNEKRGSAFHHVTPRSVWAFALLLVVAMAMIERPASAAPPDASPAPSASPTEAVDLRPVFKRYSLEPRAQGKRGTCSVFTIVDAIEYAVAKRDRTGTRLFAVTAATLYHWVNALSPAARSLIPT